MISMLAGRTHHVYSGISLISNDKCITEYEDTVVHFAEMSDE